MHTVNPTIVFASHLALHINNKITHFYRLHTEKGSLTPKAAFLLFVLNSFLSHSFMHTHFVLFLPFSHFIPVLQGFKWLATLLFLQHGSSD